MSMVSHNQSLVVDIMVVVDIWNAYFLTACCRSGDVQMILSGILFAIYELL